MNLFEQQMDLREFLKDLATFAAKGILIEISGLENHACGIAAKRVDDRKLKP